MKINQGIVKIGTALALVSTTILSSLGLISCGEVTTADEYSHTFILEEGDNVSTKHKGREVGGFADATYETKCGYKTSPRGVTNEDKGIHHHLVTWRAYQYEKDIHPSILENAETCSECFGN